MNKINDGGWSVFGNSAVPGGCCGMTLRDYFAGQALIGLLLDNNTTYVSISKSAYEAADNMLKERKQNDTEA